MVVEVVVMVMVVVVVEVVVRTGSCSSRDDGGDVTKACTRTLVAVEYRPFCKLCSHECSWRDSYRTMPRDCGRWK